MRMKMTGLVFLLLWLAPQWITAQDLSFHLPDIDNRPFRLMKQDSTQLTVVCFLGTECPLAKLYTSRLNELVQEFPDVDFVGVCSNQQDSLDELKSYRDKHKIGFPLVKDRNNLVADQFHAQRTPEVFVVDQQLTIRYQGRIDDQYQPGLAKSAPTRDDLKLALVQCLEGDEVTVASTSPLGCLIGRVRNGPNPNSKVTYARQISRLLQNHCSECHRDGQIGPMSLTDYDEIVGWAEMIQEVVDDNRMPPWHADPQFGQFVNERRMTESEKQMLRDWIDAGTPLGDEAELPSEITTHATSEWHLPKQPDLVVEMRAKPFDVPAEGVVEYQYFVVDPGFEEDKWVTAAEILPGDRSVVHHSIVFVRPPDGRAFRGIGWLAAYVPGQGSPTYNPKFGRRIPAGSKLVFQQHYTPTGNETPDMTRIGLVFGEEEKIENEVFTLLALDQEFVIPPGSPSFDVDAQFPWLPSEGQLHAFSPHMHYRGKSFELTADVNGESQVLLNVPEYDFNWQHIYQLKDPIPLSSLKSLRFKASFDNSSENASNPDPTQYVTWGDQTWEEMAVAFAIVSEPRDSNLQGEVQISPEEQKIALERKKKVDARAEKFADEFFERFDQDGDGRVSTGELPRSTQRYGSWQIDTDQDGLITREEVTQAARERYQRKIR